jgi:hypothetical protein
VPPHAAAPFWQTELPAATVERLLSRDASTESADYDLLVVDEAQDLLDDQMLDVFELIVGGGLAGGHWAMFGDFEKQAIYANANAEPGLQRLRSRVGANVTVCPMRINCRNARTIADAVTLASGLVPGYARVLAEAEG